MVYSALRQQVRSLTDQNMRVHGCFAKLSNLQSMRCTDSLCLFSPLAHIQRTLEHKIDQRPTVLSRLSFANQ